MRRHISNEDFAELKAICQDWQSANDAHDDCVDGMLELFDCTPVEAVELLSKHKTARCVLDAAGVEIHDGRKCSRPWPKLDGETLAVWLLIANGAIVVHVAAMFG